MGNERPSVGAWDSGAFQYVPPYVEYDISYTYDAVGNRLTKVDVHEGTTTYVYDAANQLTSEITPLGTINYEYDLNGNRIEKDDPVAGVTNYTYDETNRMTSATTPDSAVVSLIYNAADQVVEKHSPDGVRKYVYDGKKLLLETKADDSTELVYDFALMDEYGELTSRYHDATAGTDYYQYDGLGSTETMSDEAEADVDVYRYKAFGQIVQQFGTEDNPFTFVGRMGYWLMQEIDLYFAGASGGGQSAKAGEESNAGRLLDPPTGRFDRQDPLREDERNLYPYAGNNPVNKTDPSGNQSSSAELRALLAETRKSLASARAEEQALTELAPLAKEGIGVVVEDWQEVPNPFVPFSRDNSVECFCPRATMIVPTRSTSFYAFNSAAYGAYYFMLPQIRRYREFLEATEKLLERQAYVAERVERGLPVFIDPSMDAKYDALLHTYQDSQGPVDDDKLEPLNKADFLKVAIINDQVVAGPEWAMKGVYDQRLVDMLMARQQAAYEQAVSEIKAIHQMMEDATESYVGAVGFLYGVHAPEFALSLSIKEGTEAVLQGKYAQSALIFGTLLPLSGLWHGLRRLRPAIAAGERRLALAAALRSGVSSADSLVVGSLRTDTQFGLNYFKSSIIRKVMSRTAAGKRALEAVEKGEVRLEFNRGIPNTTTAPPPNLYGICQPGNPPEATVYLWNLQNGRLYKLLGVRASGYEAIAGTAAHEIWHGLGIAGSRRAEALVRLGELELIGVRIDARAMRQVLQDMRAAGTYNQPWRVGGSSPQFPGLGF